MLVVSVGALPYHQCAPRNSFPAEVAGVLVLLLSLFCTQPVSAQQAAASVSRSASDKEQERDALVLTLGTSRPVQINIPSVFRLNVRDAKLEQVLAPMNYPFAFEFVSESEALITLHSGSLLRANLVTGASKEISGLPEIAVGTGQMGLLDIELHPDFTTNRRIYLSYAKPYQNSPRYSVLEVSTGILVGNQLVDMTPLLNYDRYSWAPSNFGGALEFGGDGNLYVTFGDRGEESGATRRGDSLEGKVLRVTDTGAVPSDNPFIGVDGYDPRIYAVGLRNAQGLFFDAHSGLLLEAEHGPLGGDEVNIIEAGKDYGFPTVSYGGYYADGRPFGLGTHAEGTTQPIFYFLPSIAASKVTIYRGDMFPEWDGDVLVTALAGQHVAKLDLDGKLVRSSYPLLAEVGGRIRDIKVAPDGSIFILSQTHGLKRLYREAPPQYMRPRNALDASVPPPIRRSDLGNEPFLVREVGERAVTHPGKALYILACSGCHDSGLTPAQDLGDREAWAPILAQEPVVTREHVIFGHGDMPAMGFCNSCPIPDIYLAIGYMLEEATSVSH